MSFLKDIWNDLVEKRLWPVAALLVAALLAVPVLMAGGGQDAPPAGAETDAPVAEAPPGAGGAQVSLAGPTAAADRGGAVRNPFKGDGADPGQAVADAGSTAGAGAGATSVPPAPAGAGAPSTPAVVTGSPPERATPARAPARSADDHRVTVRVSWDGGKRTIRDFDPGMALGSEDAPLLSFVGVQENRTLRFLRSSEAFPVGEGTCRPNRISCAFLDARAGDLVVLDRLREGEVQRLAVRIVSVVPTGAARTRAVAAGARR